MMKKKENPTPGLLGGSPQFRTKDVLPGFLLAFIFIFSGFSVLWFYELRTLEMFHHVEDILLNVVTLTRTDTMYPENDGRLVHAVGQLSIEEKASDTQLGVSSPSIHLKRFVQMYQWIERTETRQVEDAKGIREEVFYMYEKGWSVKLHSVNEGTYVNPLEFPIENKIFNASQIKLGTFFLSQNLIDQVKNYKPVELEDATDQMKKLKLYGKEPFLHTDNFIYFCQDDIENHIIGDVRLKYESAGAAKMHEMTEPNMFSILARQDNHDLISYRTKTGQMSIEFLVLGKETPKTIILSALKFTSAEFWATRVMCVVLTAVGFKLFILFLKMLKKHLPTSASNLLAKCNSNIIPFLLSMAVNLFLSFFVRFIHKPYRFSAQTMILLVMSLGTLLLVKIKLSSCQIGPTLKLH